MRTFSNPVWEIRYSIPSRGMTDFSFLPVKSWNIWINFEILSGDNDDLEIPLVDIHSLHFSLLELFGKKGVRSLQLRIGMEMCRIGIERRSGIVRALKVGSRLLAESQQLQIALEKYTEQAEERQPASGGAPRFLLHESEQWFELTDRDYHMGQGLQSEWPVCNDIVGVLSYLLEWVTGHSHEVEEIECRAMGYPADVFRIHKEQRN
jgi:hypothetical protein